MGWLDERAGDQRARPDEILWASVGGGWREPAVQPGELYALVGQRCRRDNAGAARGQRQGDRSMRRTVESPRTSATRTSSAPVAPGTQLVVTTGMDREMPQSTTRRRAVTSPRAHSRDDRLPLIDKVASRRGYPDGAWAPRSTSLPPSCRHSSPTSRSRGSWSIRSSTTPRCGMRHRAGCAPRSTGCAWREQRSVAPPRTTAPGQHLPVHRSADPLPGPKTAAALAQVSRQESPKSRPVTVHTYEPVAARPCENPDRRISSAGRASLRRPGLSHLVRSISLSPPSR